MNFYRQIIGSIGICGLVLFVLSLYMSASHTIKNYDRIDAIGTVVSYDININKNIGHAVIQYNSTKNENITTTLTCNTQNIDDSYFDPVLRNIIINYRLNKKYPIGSTLFLLCVDKNYNVCIMNENECSYYVDTFGSYVMFSIYVASFICLLVFFIGKNAVPFDNNHQYMPLP